MDADAEGEAAHIEAFEAAHLGTLAVVVAHTGEDCLANVDFNTHLRVAQQVVGKPFDPSLLGHLAREGVGLGGGTQRVLVAEVPPLQLVGGEEEAEGRFGEFVGHLGRELERKTFARAVEGEELRPDIARCQGGGKAFRWAEIAQHEVEREGKGAILVILRQHGSGHHAEVQLVVVGETPGHRDAPTRTERIVGGMEVSRADFLLVVALKRAIVVEAESEEHRGDTSAEVGGIGQRAH